MRRGGRGELPGQPVAALDTNRPTAAMAEAPVGLRINRMRVSVITKLSKNCCDDAVQYAARHPLRTSRSSAQ